MKYTFSKIKIWVAGAILLLSAASCSKYVDKVPLDAFSDLDYWTSESKVETFCWGFYDDLIVGFGTGTSGDFYFSSFSDDQDAATFQDFDKNAPASDGAWSFTDIRKSNLLLARIGNVPMDDAAKNHWAGVARFFRAMKYFNMVKRFGDVPWYNQVLDISQDSMIYKPRDPRNMIMDSVLADLDFAIANLRSKADADANTVNKDVALAFKSRVCLYEGTYAEYDENDNTRAVTYLKASQDASSQLMNADYTLDKDYRTVYSSMELKDDPEVILYKDYEAGLVTHSVVGYTNSTTPMNGMTKSAVESYVCADGLPISVSPEYQGDDSIQPVRANRDERLLETIDTFYCYNGHRVGIGLQSSTGYRPSKFLQPSATQLAPYNETDAPIFWLAETLENYAEASAELDKLGAYTMTQSDLDKSINLLRKRAGVAALQVSGKQGTAVGGVVFTDKKKDPDVTSLIWEIRRDRRSELMMDGFRFDDLVRWKKLDYMDSQKNPDGFLGAKVPANGSVSLNPDGYIMPYAAGIQRTVQARDYLYPIPTGQFPLYANGALSQNTGW